MRAVNLLPPELRVASRRRRSSTPAGPATGGSGPFLVIGALALCLLAVAAYVLTVNTVTERRSELARVTAAQDAAASRAAALKPYGDFQEMANRRTQTVTSLAGLRFDWEQALRDVSRALPGTVTLSGLDGSISTDTGASSSPLRGAIGAPAITLKGCTSNQSAVATMLSRLRGIRGATRVTLSKSERVVAAAAPSGQDAPCGKGAPPQFEVVVFFERSGAGAGAPSAAVPGAVATGAPGAAASPAAPSSATGATTTQPASSTPVPAEAGTP